MAGAVGNFDSAFWVAVAVAVAAEAGKNYWAYSALLFPRGGLGVG